MDTLASLILPLFHGHADKRFNIAIGGEQDDEETTIAWIKRNG
jgi:hypothetical protein